MRGLLAKRQWARSERQYRKKIGERNEWRLCFIFEMDERDLLSGSECPRKLLARGI